MPGVAAEVRAVGLLAQRQRVHVGAQAHHAGRIAAAQHAHHARAGQPLVHFHAGFAQRSGHDAGWAPLFVGQLRMCMQVAAQRDQRRQQIVDAVVHQ
jgi:hypothetical protein